LFVYNYDRPYPFELVQNPVAAPWAGYVLGGLVALVALWQIYRIATEPSERSMVALVVCGLLVPHGLGAIGARFFSGRVPLALAVGLALFAVVFVEGKLSPTMFLGLALMLPAAYLFYEASLPTQEYKTSAYLAGGLVGIAALVLFVRGIRNPVAADLLLSPDF